MPLARLKNFFRVSDVISITPDLQLISNIIGSMRSAINRNAGTKDAKVGPQDGAQADIDGVLGELAFCKWKNVWPDLSIAARSGSYDCIVNGLRIDVKTTRIKSGRLLSTLKSNSDVDIYVLAIIEDGFVNFPGYMFAKEFRRDENIADLGHGKTYCVERNQMRKFKEN